MFLQVAALAGQPDTNEKMRVTSILLKQYETVVYAQSAILSSTNVGQTLALPFNELVDALNAIQPGAVSNLQLHYSGLFVGAKDFTMPEGLGAVSSHRCYIAMPEDGIPADGNLIFRKAKQASIAGRQVWTWETPPYEGHPKPTDYYAAKIENGLVVVTNDRQDFFAAASDLISSSALDAPALNTPGWKGLIAHNYWIYRAFRRDRVIDRTAAASAGPAANVEALAFGADFDTGSGVIQVISSDQNMTHIPKLLAPSESTQMRPAGLGVWQATIPLSKNQETTNALFQLFYYLGFGVAV